MAGEITLTVNLRVANAAYAPGTVAITKAIDQSTQGAAGGVASVTTDATTAISSGNLTDKGTLLLVNLDTANFVTVGGSSGSLPIKLLPGEPNVFRTTTDTTVFGKADTATCKVWYEWLEE